MISQLHRDPSILFSLIHRCAYCTGELKIPEGIPELHSPTTMVEKISDGTVLAVKHGEEILHRGAMKLGTPHRRNVLLHLEAEGFRHEEKAARPVFFLLTDARVADANQDYRESTHTELFNTDALNQRRRFPRAVHSKWCVEYLSYLLAKWPGGTPAGGPRLG